MPSKPGVLQQLTHCDGIICLFCCLSYVPGLVKRIVNQVAFFPPKPPGYHVTSEKQVFLVDADYGLTPLPDLTSDGIAVDTVRMWTSKNNVIIGFHFRRADSTKTLLFSHGNSTDIGIMFHHLADLCTHLRVDIFAYEYSGYGESSGVPSENDILADIDAAYHYLTHDCSIPENQIVLYGQSVGGVPTIDLASRSYLGGVILHSTFKSGLGVIHDVKTTFWFDVFRNAEKVQKIQCPIFMMHGTHDAEIPFEHAVAIHEAIPPELAYDPWWVKEGGHNDIEISFRAQYFQKIQQFLDYLDSHDRRGETYSDQVVSDVYSNQPLLGGAPPPHGYSYEPMNHNLNHY